MNDLNKTRQDKQFLEADLLTMIRDFEKSNDIYISKITLYWGNDRFTASNEGNQLEEIKITVNI